jgi:hypothetical protein
VRRPPTGTSNWLRAFRFVLMLGLLVVATSLPAAEHEGSIRKNEFKLLVTAVDSAIVLKALGLERQSADKEIIYFFDTSDKMLQAHHVTLRARQPVGRSGDATVKLRATTGTLELSDEERTLQPEQDWTSEHDPTEARSLTRVDLPDDLISQVGDGSMPVASLFSKEQQNLARVRLPGVDWKSLKKLGPIEAQVWSRQGKLNGVDEPVTVELWQLRQDNREQQILEVSAKGKVKTDAEAQLQARQFFAAAKAAGLGEPGGQTKTKLVLDFFSTQR